MTLTRRTLAPATLLALTAGLVALPVRADKPAAPQGEVWHVDDDAIQDQFTEKLAALAKDGKCLAPDKLKTLAAADRTTTLTPAMPTAARLDPEDVYKKALPSVFVVGSVVPDPDDDDEFTDGRMATAWVLAADGVLVTNWHVFDGIEDGERFGVFDHEGHVYPLTDLLAVNKSADLAVFRVDAKGLTPLPLAARPAAVGSWVGVLGHPGDRYWTFTQGNVSRYTKAKREGGGTEKWMSITADYAYGSSGSPVLDRTGAVVGMAALTETLDYPEADPKPDGKPGEKKEVDGKPAKPADPPAAAKGSLVQMIVKLTVPAAALRNAGGK